MIGAFARQGTLPTVRYGKVRKQLICATVYAPNWSQDEVQAVEDCLCEINEPVGQWLKTEAVVDSAAVNVVVPRNFMPHIEARKSKHRQRVVDTTLGQMRR